MPVSCVLCNDIVALNFFVNLIFDKLNVYEKMSYSQVLKNTIVPVCVN